MCRSRIKLEKIYAINMQMRRDCSREMEKNEFDSEVVAKVCLCISFLHSLKIESRQKEGTEGLIWMNLELRNPVPIHLVFTNASWERSLLLSVLLLWFPGLGSWVPNNDKNHNNTS